LPVGIHTSQHRRIQEQHRHRGRADSAQKTHRSMLIGSGIDSNNICASCLCDPPDALHHFRCR
jgi:hypothetical protein